MANLEKNDQRVERGYFGEIGIYGEHPPKSLSKNSNQMARGPLKVAILTKMANMAKFVKALTTCQIRWQRGPLKSGDVDENGEYGEK